MPKYSRSWKASAEGQACATVTTVFVVDSGKRSVMIGILRICPLAAVNSQHTIQATYFRACEREGCLLLWSARASCVSGDRGLVPLDRRLSSFLDLSRMSRIVASLPVRVRNCEGGGAWPDPLHPSIFVTVIKRAENAQVEKTPRSDYISSGVRGQFSGKYA